MTGTNPTPRAARAKAPTNRSRDFWLLGGLFALMIIGLASLAAATGWQETIDQIKRLSWGQIALLFALSLVNYGFRGLRWHLFAVRLRLNTGLMQNLRHFIGGFAMSVTPGRVGELVRMRWIRRETGWSFESTAPLVLVDRASDLAAMALILGLAITLSAGGIGGAVPVTILALLAAYIATRPSLLAGIATITYKSTGIWPRLFAKFRRAARSLARFSHP